MSTTAEAGSVWYVVSMSWFTNWQKHVKYEQVGETMYECSDKMNRSNPGKIDNTDILLPFDKK